jgi:prepilin signal peptidase PulO-like enzyme (type II secretory pathway)
VWYDNIPVFSFILLKGKCRNCGQKISWQYPIVELVTGLLFLVPTLFVSYPSQEILIKMIVQWFIIIDLILIFLYDFKYQEIWDRFTLIPAGLIFVANLFFYWQNWSSMLIGVLIGAGFFLLQYLVSKGKWIGGGDIRLGVLMGVILGWQNTILALFISYLVGAIVGIGLIIAKKKNRDSAVPFGTFLVIGTFVAMFWGERIVLWYLSLLR